jgi:hypothetical protein
MDTAATHDDAREPVPGLAERRFRAAAAVLSLVLAYLGFLAGAPLPDVREGPIRYAAQASLGSDHLVSREGPRATVAAERPDPRASGSPKPPGLERGRTRDSEPAGGLSTAVAIIDPSVDGRDSRRAHPPRAPPALTA